MVSVFLRTFLLYVILIGTIRLMGKRQIGELQLSELVTTLMISEFAVIPIQDKDIPVTYAIIPICLLLSIEVIFSFILLKSSTLRKIFMGTPSIIIYKGRLLQHELKDLRLGINELLSELRLKDISDISDVEYAILEENGKLSVFTKSQKNTLTPEHMGIQPEENGLAHPVIIDGEVSQINLRLANKNEKWLEKYLKDVGKNKSDIFLMTVDDCGKTDIIMRDKEIRGKK